MLLISMNIMNILIINSLMVLNRELYRGFGPATIEGSSSYRTQRLLRVLFTFKASRRRAGAANSIQSNPIQYSFIKKMTKRTLDRRNVALSLLL